MKLIFIWVLVLFVWWHRRRWAHHLAMSFLVQEPSIAEWHRHWARWHEQQMERIDKLKIP